MPRIGREVHVDFGRVIRNAGAVQRREPSRTCVGCRNGLFPEVDTVVECVYTARD